MFSQPQWLFPVSFAGSSHFPSLRLSPWSSSSVSLSTYHLEFSHPVWWLSLWQWFPKPVSQTSVFWIQLSTHHLELNIPNSDVQILHPKPSLRFLFPHWWLLHPCSHSGQNLSEILNLLYFSCTCQPTPQAIPPLSPLKCIQNPARTTPIQLLISVLPVSALGNTTTPSQPPNPPLDSVLASEQEGLDFITAL